MKKHIPNTITLCNLLSGCVACFLAVNSDAYLSLAALFIIFAAVFDFFDGFVARLLKAYSPKGKELDSLADLISFGIAPSAIVSMLIRVQLGHTETIDLALLPAKEIIFIFAPFILTAFSALRLAKFNIDTRQTSSFIGMPTPANALFIISLVLIANYGDIVSINKTLLAIPALLIITVVNSYLLVSPIPMFSLKFKTYGLAGNQLRYFFLLLSIAAIITLQAYSLTAIIIIYLLLSVIDAYVVKKKKD